MNSVKADLIRALHASPWKWVLALTGGGTQAAADLLNVPGGSRTVLEIVVPYGEPALAEFLGRPPEQYCSVETSRAMAARALQRAAWLAPRQPVLGVAVTASLATDRPKQGDHRFHISIHWRERLTDCSLVLTKNTRRREEEEELVDAVLLNALAEACGIDNRLPLPLHPQENLVNTAGPAPGLLAALLRGQQARVCVDAHGRWSGEATLPAALLPGSFNPIHQGHWRLAEVAGRLLQAPVHFEISVVNVDKPPLRAEEIDARLEQFRWQAPVWLSRAPTFVEKSALFPGAVFVVGMDTAVRIIDPKYYGQDDQAMKVALRQVGDRGCRFLVAGRNDGASFQGLECLHPPAEFAGLFTAIQECDFRWDISSTQVRASSLPAIAPKSTEVG